MAAAEKASKRADTSTPARRAAKRHQVRALRWARNKNKIGLFMEMRLGKTLVAIRWAWSRKRRDLTRLRRILVVCPIETARSWIEELAMEGHASATLMGTATQRSRALERGAEAGVSWYLLNWENVKDNLVKRADAFSEIAGLDWDVVLFDESTRARNPKAHVSRAAVRAFDGVRYKGLLTGLPNPEGAEDYVMQLLLLRGEVSGPCGETYYSYWTWRADCCQPVGYEWHIKPAALRALREDVTKHAFSLTRKEAGFKDHKVRELLTVQLPSRVTTIMRDAQKDWGLGDKLTSNRLELLTWMMRLAGGGEFQVGGETYKHDAKSKVIARLLTGELRNEPIVVWARYTAELVGLANALERANVSFEHVHGQAGRVERTRRIQRFRKGGCRVLLAQPKCVKMGEDLSRASVAVYMSNYWDFELRAQTEDRIVNMKKNDSLLIVDVVAEGTPDEDIAAALTQKGATARSFKRDFLERINQRMKKASITNG